jgi:von Willebrand factor A domain-containing protein 7
MDFPLFSILTRYIKEETLAIWDSLSPGLRYFDKMLLHLPHDLLCIGIALYLTGLTIAFIPTTKLSLGNLIGRSHYTITQDAVVSVDIEFFNIDTLTVSMTKARDEIADANAKVDITDKHNAPSHFDGESFQDGQDRLVSLRDSVKKALLAGDGSGARQFLGQALHTVQDFYSHSNWIEMGNSDINNDILGLRTGNVIPRPPTTSVTCTNCIDPIPLGREVTIACQNTCKFGDTPAWKAAITLSCLLGACDTTDCGANLITNALTSGYYSDEGATYTKPGPIKCSHGGAFDGSAEGIEASTKTPAVLSYLPTICFINKQPKSLSQPACSSSVSLRKTQTLRCAISSCFLA